MISRTYGAKGGGTPPQPRSPVEAPNTLQSRATGRIIDIIAEGECVGLATGDGRSVFLDKTPLVSGDGRVNFPGVTFEQRTGTPDQDWVRGFPAIENEVGLNNIPVKAGAANAVTRSILDTNTDAVRVTVTIPALYQTDTTTGDTNGARVDFTISVRTQNGAFSHYPIVIEGKNTSPYQEAYRIALPGAGPWDVRIERVTPDSTQGTLQNELFWSSYTAIIDRKLTYPNSGLVALTFDAETFGNQVPQREYDWKGWICRVPTNYDPDTRIYTGIWDGSFKRAWTDNPAWLFLQLLTHRWGAGLDDSQVDIWSLYAVAQYCDQMIPDGYGGTEPRFTANFVLNSREDAYAVINSLASTFRAMVFWASGGVSLVQDAPADPVVLVTPSNTIDGFDYAGPGLKARHSVVYVAFHDARDNYARSVEVYQDPDLIAEFGWKSTEVTAFACTSRGQARRVGKWLLETEKASDEALTYSAALDHIYAGPGMVVEVQDPDFANLDGGGRLVSATTTTVTLDRPFTIETSKSYKIRLTLPTADQNADYEGPAIVERTVTNVPGTHTTLTVAPSLPTPPQPESQWLIEVSDVFPRQFKLVALQEENDLQFKITALLHDPNKFARVEEGIHFEPPPFTRLPDVNVVQPPSGISVERRYVSTAEGWTWALEVSWIASPDPYVRGYVVRYQRNLGAWTTLPEVSGTSTTIYGEGAGSYVFHVQAVNLASKMSRPATFAVDILNESPITLLRPTGLELEGQGNDTTFTGRDPKFVWRGTGLRGSYPLGEEPHAGAGYIDHIFRHFEVRAYDAVTGRLVFTDQTTLTWYVFSFEKNSGTPGGPRRRFVWEVVMVDRWGNISLPARLEVQNPAPPVPANLSIRPGYLAISVQFDRPADLDFQGTLIWVSTVEGFTPTDGQVRYDGPDTFKLIEADANVPHYVRVAGYDSFGKADLNISSEFMVLPRAADEVDTIPPGVPTGLVLSSHTEVGEDGQSAHVLAATWTENPEEDLFQYALQIREFVEGQGVNVGWVSSVTDTNAYEWRGVAAGRRYEVRLRATDRSGNSSIYSGAQSHIVAGDTVPPATPTGFTVKWAFRTIWLQWPEPVDADHAYMEVWEAPTRDRTQATVIGRPRGTEFPREDLPAGVERYYWIRAVDLSGNKSGFYPESPTGGFMGRTRKVEEADYAELSIGRAAIKELAVDDAKIANLSAAKLMAGTTLTGSILVDGQYALRDIGGDPAGRINTGSTKILPGQIEVNGSTTLADWRHGGNNSLINGGWLATNSVRANSLEIGNRAVTFEGVQFTPNATTGVLSWTSGWVTYMGTSGNETTEAISAGSYTYQGTPAYITWGPGLGRLVPNLDQTVAGRGSRITLAVYRGGSNFFASYGRVIIDGNGIQAESINADRIQANSITARQLSVTELITASAQIREAIITRTHIGNAQIDDAHITGLTATKILAGSITSGNVTIGHDDANGRLLLQGSEGLRRILYFDQNGTPRVLLGRRENIPNADTDGIFIWDRNGREIITANGLGLNVVGNAQITNLAVDTLKIRGESVTVTRRAVAHGYAAIQGISTSGHNAQQGVFCSLAVPVPISAAVQLTVNVFAGNLPKYQEQYLCQLPNGAINVCNRWHESHALYAFGNGSTYAENEAWIWIQRNGVTIYQIGTNQLGTADGNDGFNYDFPAALNLVDYPGPGTHTYQIVGYARAYSAGSQWPVVTKVHMRDRSLTGTVLMR